MNTLIALRKENGMTQNDVARKLGITRQAYGHYESGARIPPTDNLERLANLFGVTTDYLLGRTDERTAKSAPTAEAEAQELDRLKNEIMDLYDTLDESEQARAFALLQAAFAEMPKKGTDEPEALVLS